MITFSVCVSLFVLAVIAAIFSQQHSDWVLDIDRDRFFPPFFASEGFYRAFLINLSFAGISTAAGALQHVKYSAFWMICDPFLAILMNLGLGLFAALALTADTKEFKSKERRVWTFALVFVGVACFAFAVWVTAELAGPKRPLADASMRRLAIAFQKSPADDNALRQWFERQPDTRSVRITRGNQQLLVQYSRESPVLGPSEHDWKAMGYEDPTLIETGFSDQPLSWWVTHVPATAWVVFAFVSILSAILLSSCWRLFARRSTRGAVPATEQRQGEAGTPPDSQGK